MVLQAQVVPKGRHLRAVVFSPAYIGWRTGMVEKMLSCSVVGSPVGPVKGTNSAWTVWPISKVPLPC